TIPSRLVYWLGTTMIQPRKAPVRPRGCSADSGEPQPLENELLARLERGQRGVIALVGPPGSGKTTALQHLAAGLPHDSRVLLLDKAAVLGQVSQAIAEGLSPDSVADYLANYATLASPAATPDLLVYTTPMKGVARESHLAIYHLAPWTKDDLIEYLLA